ncbi:MAG: FAD-binding oxidoreductase [Vicinamibacterales bacterium]
MRHLPYWFDRFPKTRRPSYPRLKGHQATRVVIIGGGLTGASCALAFTSAGLDVVLLEAELVGSGATAAGDGVVREGFSGSFTRVAAQHGVRHARALSDGMRRGGLDFASALRRLNIRCELAPSELLTVEPSADAAKLLRREYSVRKEAGATAAWVTSAGLARDAALDAGGAIRTHAAALDPYRACLGIAGAAAQRGTTIHERSAVTRIRASTRGVEITTAGGSVRADTVVVATGAPLSDLRPLRRHLVSHLVYNVVTEPLPAAIRRQVGKRTATIEAGAGADRLVRWIADDRAFVGGGRQREVPQRLRERALTQRTGQLMYELSLMYPAISGLQPAWSWDVVDYETVDGMPFVGSHRNFPGHLFAFTPVSHGPGLAWTAARLLVRQYQGEAVRGDESFGFGRIL